MVLHIPHSSIEIPEKYREIFLISDEELKDEILKMTDLYTDDLFDFSDNRVVFGLSRLLCDVERFRNPLKEEMTDAGMWICYSRAHDGRCLKEFEGDHIGEMLKEYDRHHEKLTVAVEHEIEAKGACLLIDCHSFSSVRLPYETCGAGVRPDICIGTNDFHTPEWLSAGLKKGFENLGYTVAMNYPFSGTIVPMKYYRKNDAVHSIMIEVNRSLYMDEKSGEKSLDYQKVKANIRSAMETALRTPTADGNAA